MTLVNACQATPVLTGREPSDIHVVAREDHILRYFAFLSGAYGVAMHGIYNDEYALGTILTREE